MNEHPPQDNQPPPEPQRPLNEWPQQPYPQQPYPQQPPRKKRGPLFWLLVIGGVLLIFVVGLTILNAALHSSTTTSADSTPVPTNISSLDKDGNNDQGANVQFTCQIVNFVKDNNGNTVGANVDDPNALGTVVQVIFPNGTDLSQLNQGDTLVVQGTDKGVYSGQNAFGATVQEVGISAQYMTDQTTGYQTH